MPRKSTKKTLKPVRPQLGEGVEILNAGSVLEDPITRTLVLTMLYRLTPTLINEGYVYIAESPLYEINTKDRTYFAYTEPEKATFLEEIGDKKYTIQRSKGLGENDPEMMWLTTMNPESRRLIKVLPTDVEETARVFDLLLGDNLAGRKEHIAAHGAEYLDDLDVS